jgi:hypothetical protein
MRPPLSRCRCFRQFYERGSQRPRAFAAPLPAAPDSEQFRFAPRTRWPLGGIVHHASGAREWERHDVSRFLNARAIACVRSGNRDVLSPGKLAREHAKQVNDPVLRQCLIAMERRWLSRVHGDEFFGRPPEKPGLTRHWQGRWIGGLQGRFRTFQVDPKDLAGPVGGLCPSPTGLRRGRDTMLYPCSPSLQSLPVPSIGFCQTIFVDQDAVVRPHRRFWPLIPGWVPISTDRTPQGGADLAAVAYRLG